ncbi:DNA polymerase III subunit gamma/tau, partial [Acinetobacter sp. UBA2063]
MYQVLARKYRPRNFNELVGQNHVSRALTSALERGRLHHAYLFTGTRGVGKTTIARILAKCLNCETGVTSTPCEVCATCKAVNEGRFIDLIEIDAASRTKVEDTRELLDNVPYAPTQGRFKVYLIDEVHMLSTHSFNALLKTLEEPPEHVKFLFATTDPQKLPITVISRCLQFTLRPLAVDEITTHLTAILNKEHIEADQDAIWQIAESAQGSLRDALSLTDQAIAYGQGAVHHQDVKDMLGLIDRTIIYDLILAIHHNQQAHVSQLLLQFRQQALDVSLVLDQLVSTLHELALLQYLPDLALKYSEEINRKILHLSKLISAQDLQLYYQIACKGRSDLQLAVTQEQGFEMCVLRLLAFRPLSAGEITVGGTNPQNIVVSHQQVVSTEPSPAEIQQLQQVTIVEEQLVVQQEMVSVEPEPEP